MFYIPSYVLHHIEIGIALLIGGGILWLAWRIGYHIKLAVTVVILVMNDDIDGAERVSREFLAGESEAG